MVFYSNESKLGNIEVIVKVLIVYTNHLNYLTTGYFFLMKIMRLKEKLYTFEYRNSQGEK